MAPIDVAISVISFGVLAFVLYIVGASIYYFIHKDDPDIEPPDWWPDFLKNFVHNYPPNYSVTSNTMVVGTTLNVFSSNIMSVSDCATDEDSGCNFSDDCIGFTYVPTASANTCVTYSSINSIIRDSTVTTSLYVVEGNEPSKTYNVYSNSATDTYTRTSNILEYTGGTYSNCASNCSANTTCLGFLWISADSTCKQKTNIQSSNLVSFEGATAYILQSSSFTSADV